LAGLFAFGALIDEMERIRMMRLLADAAWHQANQ